MIIIGSSHEVPFGMIVFAGIVYIPSRRYRVSPGRSRLKALVIVFNGKFSVPGFVSFPVGER